MGAGRWVGFPLYFKFTARTDMCPPHQEPAATRKQPVAVCSPDIIYGWCKLAGSPLVHNFFLDLFLSRRSQTGVERGGGADSLADANRTIFFQQH